MLLIFCTIAHCAVFGKAEVWVSCFLFQKISPKNPLQISVLLLYASFSPLFFNFAEQQNFFKFFHVRKVPPPCIPGKLQISSAAA